MVGQGVCIFTFKDYVNQIVIPQNSSAKIINQQKYFRNLDAVVAEGFSGAGSPGLVAFIAKETNIIELFSDGIDEAIANKFFPPLNLSSKNKLV
ncbi:MAG: hypothetical protein UU73_C0002G0200 [Candidatus Daviesbacteria bacterium GW2011_GWA1_41_61]|uniref:Uncharacterized protein n=1 Tax=Candidatus Daviesbacteria bacterium GW2011_GWA2_40_9 TaxID=1618424 RepID=A0A0G0U3X4_9BACT|nr:MAG: hypothetical protein UU26_C0009G0002 [Candidatus Daviesbacteria bacterium GW2011_GWC1_40_9]KKR81861.1 MAG: hypothetical protein UU29_C0022G0008 [Candidatus Daviesbacteria bacterium GW2011_GWA2_40_9]KKR93860.1 MAG: hypothetical protein UU44_C0001G0200 [Candidatus Daviesbacteria bacterium GW2011_GWB1_41_15]KKS15326.1 MAG: hypothetical protein UU73_C0002G0200 [Candidatus Daviesbacteria bacterium GW2011_GWA1_41_61]